MTKILIHIALIGWVLVFPISVSAQVVAIRLEIPAGVQFRAELVDSRMGDTWEKNKAKVWVGIEAQENLTLLLEVNYPNREILPTPESFFLNDGSADFENAVNLGGGTHALRMNTQNKLIRKMDPSPPYLKSWLGLPVIQGLTVKIEYP